MKVTVEISEEQMVVYLKDLIETAFISNFNPNKWHHPDDYMSALKVCKAANILIKHISVKGEEDQVDLGKLLNEILKVANPNLK